MTLLAPAAAEDRVGAKFFDSKVAPLLTKRCLGCHNNELKDAEVSFVDRQSLLVPRGGRPPVVVPGKPEQSPLVSAVRQTGDARMPPGGRLSRKEIAALEEWIRRGAPWGAKLRAP
jgi:hypothetical protein